MSYLILTITLITLSSQNILIKQYNRNVQKTNAILYSAFVALYALLFFCIYPGSGGNFKREILPYSIGFAIAYGSATIAMNLAIATGSLAISTLVSSYALLIPTLYGIIFLKESLKVTSYIGIVLLFLSLHFINMKKEASIFSVKWLIYLLIMFVGNGMCSTIQKMQQIRFGGAYKKEFMIVALGCTFILLVFMLRIQKAEIKGCVKDCFKYAMPAGIANGATNLLVMTLTGMLPNALLFPSISAGGILIMFLISFFVYKENMTKKQLIGYSVGIVSVILINL